MYIGGILDWTLEFSWDCISTSFSFDFSMSARTENRFWLEKELVFCIFALGEIGDLGGTVCQLFELSLLLIILTLTDEFELFLVVWL